MASLRMDLKVLVVSGNIFAPLVTKARKLKLLRECKQNIRAQKLAFISAFQHGYVRCFFVSRPWEIRIVLPCSQANTATLKLNAIIIP